MGPRISSTLPIVVFFPQLCSSSKDCSLTLFSRYMGALKYGILGLMDSHTISPSVACTNVPISMAMSFQKQSHNRLGHTEYLRRRAIALLEPSSTYVRSSANCDNFGACLDSVLPPPRPPPLPLSLEKPPRPREPPRKDIVGVDGVVESLAINFIPCSDIADAGRFCT